MNKKYIVRLSDQERIDLRLITDRLKGSSQKVRRANILLQADVGGPGWTDEMISQAYRCRVQTVQNVRRRLVEEGFDRAVQGKRRVSPPVEKKLDGEQEAKLIAMRLPPVLPAAQGLCFVEPEAGGPAGGGAGGLRPGRPDQP